MSSSAAIAAPRSRKEIRKIAQYIRQITGTENQCEFPIMEFAELGMPKIFPGFSVVVLSREEMKNCHGKACPEEKTIYLREDVYDGAISGWGRDRLTVAHEIGHYVLHQPGCVAYAKMEKGKKLEAFRDPEWQADAFAGELLVPASLVKGMNPEQVSVLCGVSNAAATYQLSKC